MARLFEQDFGRHELLERVGRLEQVAGVERFTFDEGASAGVKAARVRTGGGLDYTVLFSRGMDIGECSYKGIPLAWVSQTGIGHPHSFDPHGEGGNGRGWLRTFHGGLLTGCGLSNAGANNEDEGEALGLHGYLSHTPATETGAWTEWDKSEATTTVMGTMREARVFAENLRLTRRVTSKIGTNTIEIQDTVENVGFKTVPVMLLYHLNFGWPLISEHTQMVYNARSGPIPRDEIAQAGLEQCFTFEKPTEGYQEQCFFHDVQADEHNFASVLLINRQMNLGVQIRYDQVSFPHLTEWKMMGQGEYVVGIEPGNCRVFGRAKEREAGRLQFIAPDETRTFRTYLSVLDGAEAIAQAEGKQGK
jgi:galactose mutarotase-like enzyme